MMGAFFVPSPSMWWPQILDPADGVCHEGVKKKLQWVCDLFYKPNAARLIWDFIQSWCLLEDGRSKTGHLHLVGLLQPLATPSLVWADIAMDFIKGLSVVITMVDRFYKYAHFLRSAAPTLRSPSRRSSSTT